MYQFPQVLRTVNLAQSLSPSILFVVSVLGVVYFQFQIKGKKPVRVLCEAAGCGYVLGLLKATYPVKILYFRTEVCFSFHHFLLF